jgi:signal transduction histidine kinase
MNTPQKTHSIHRRINGLFLLFSSLFFIVGCSLIVTLITQEAKEENITKAYQWAKVISQQSIKVIESTHATEHPSTVIDFKNLADLVDLNYIYIYRLDSNNDVDIVAAYKKKSAFKLIPNTLNELQALTNIHYLAESFEFSYPIKNNEKTIGYLYIQFDLTPLNQKTLKISLIIFAIASIILLLNLALISWLQKSITRPIIELGHNIQQISHSKNFSMRCNEMPYRELDILAQNINIMLNRTEKYIAKQIEAEHQFIQLNRELEDKVNQRTEALREANQELLSTLETLHQYQGQLVESEKMASLGDMVAGVAHEVNTPVGLGVTSSSLLYDRLVEIKKAFENKTLKSSQLKRFLDEGEENINIIMRNLKRAADLITSFKQVAVDQSSSEERTFNLKTLLNEVIQTLAPELRNTTYQITIECPDDLVISTKPGPLNQIIVNLIMNSVIHGFDKREKGNILIQINTLANQIHLHYQDDGVGISPEIKSKIFEPFITTKRGSGGSGLGMHLVYNLVTQALNGSISFDRELTQGVVFDIYFPYTKINE